MKKEHLEIVLTSLAESIEAGRRDRAKDLAAMLDATGRALDRLIALWEIRDVLRNEEMSKKDKLKEIDQIIHGALNPDEEDHVEDDWGYQ